MSSCCGLRFMWLLCGAVLSSGVTARSLGCLAGGFDGVVESGGGDVGVPKKRRTRTRGLNSAEHFTNLNFATLEVCRSKAGLTRCGVRRRNFATLGCAVRAAANFATLEGSVRGAASEEEK